MSLVRVLLSFMEHYSKNSQKIFKKVLAFLEELLYNTFIESRSHLVRDAAYYQ